MYCFQDKVLIGFSMESSDFPTINEKTVETIENRAYNFYNHLGIDIKPKLWLSSFIILSLICINSIYFFLYY